MVTNKWPSPSKLDSQSQIQIITRMTTPIPTCPIMLDKDTTAAGRFLVRQAIYAASSGLPGLAQQCMQDALRAGAPYERGMPPYTPYDLVCFQGVLRDLLALA